MKRSLSMLTLSLLLLLALAAPARADLIWEPIGDSFYDAHRGECQSVSRSFLANGAQGYVSLLTSPDSDEAVFNVPNGEGVYAGWSWTAGDGTLWYACEYGQDSGWLDGWMPASELSLIYDNICFEEDHASEFEEYDGSGDALTRVILYSYPGGVSGGVLEEDREYQPFSKSFTNLYTDEEGRRWSRISYYKGRQNAWACLDDPLNRDLGVDAIPTAASVRGTGDDTTVPPAEDVPAPATPVWILPAGLVVAAAVVTALLVRRRA